MISLTRAQIEVIKEISSLTEDVVIEHSYHTPGSIRVTELLRSGGSIKYDLTDTGGKKYIA